MTPDDIVKMLVQNLKLRREELNATQRDIAAKAEISQCYLSELESGKKLPNILILFRIAAALRTSPAWLLSPTVTMNPVGSTVEWQMEDQDLGETDDISF
jgi:transcriptional regulator with XRE-family HTH domain